MKAIFIPENFNPSKDLEKLNRELKDSLSIESEVSTLTGRVLIVNHVTRKDKLEKINDISDEKGTTDNSI